LWKKGLLYSIPVFVFGIKVKVRAIKLELNDLCENKPLDVLNMMPLISLSFTKN